jgi:hypothetical protein
MHHSLVKLDAPGSAGVNMGKQKDLQTEGYGPRYRPEELLRIPHFGVRILEGVLPLCFGGWIADVGNAYSGAVESDSFPPVPANQNSGLARQRLTREDHFPARVEAMPVEGELVLLQH